VFLDTEAVGGTSLSTVDLASGAASVVGTIGTEVGVLGMAVDGEAGHLFGVTDVPALITIDPVAPAAPAAEVAVDAGGSTLLALARRASDGALLAIDDGGTVALVDPVTGSTAPVAVLPLEDPGVGLDVTDGGVLELVVATGARASIDPDTGTVTDETALTADETVPHVVALAHAGGTRYGIDAAADTLVTIGDDGFVETIGPLGLDVTEGASFDIAADGTAYLTSPG
jgi:hypothetical protein